ncbi:hypothetical protein ACIBCR_15590 [Micromonospora echinospora]|uniref:hypothetical protein n=1 Tax=Micromonospora echinospora TaxID=1877 RepID=UPI003791D709
MTALHPDTTTALAALIDHTAGWLDKAGLTTEAAALRALPALTTVADIEAAAPTVQPLMQTAYQRAGVITWPQADAGIAAVHTAGGLGLSQQATSPYPDMHMDPVYRAVDQFAGWLWTIACYAAHATLSTEGQRR